jgi:hypothetical protein
MYHGNKMIICTLALCTIMFSNVYAKTMKVDSLGLPGDNFDLYGALELFKKSNSPEEFEKSLNSQNNGVNNLDLNGDHQTDYIRVIDKSQGDSHSLVLQDALSATEVQDVAVISMEKNNNQIHVQIKGDEALYGKNYIIEPSDLSVNTPPANSQNPNTYNNNGYNNNGQNPNGYNNGQDPNAYNNNNGYNNNGQNPNGYNNNGQNPNAYNNNGYDDNNGYYNGNGGSYSNNYDYNNGNYDYNNNYSYNNPPPAVNVMAWPAVQYMYSPQYIPYVSPWSWNAYPGWWNPWRPMGWPAYYGRVNAYHSYYRPVAVNRMVYSNNFYAPNRSYSPAIQNRYAGVSNFHYAPRNNGVGGGFGGGFNGGFHGGGGSFNGGGGGFHGGGGSFNGGGFHGGGGGFGGGGGGGGFHGGGGGFGGGGGGRGGGRK